MATIYPPVENQVEELNQWRSIIEDILSSHAHQPYRYGDVVIHFVAGRDGNQYLLLHEGWENGCHVHGTVVHIEIRDRQIWIHFDGTEGGIAEDLVAAGIPKQSIVLAFHPLHLRPHTGYGVA